MVLLLLLIGTAYWLFARRLTLDLEQKAQAMARDVAFAVEHEEGKLQFEESIYLARRLQHPDLNSDAVVQWLDLGGTLLHHQGDLRLQPRSPQDGRGYRQLDPPAYVYVVQGLEAGRPFGYARVGLALAPLNQQLGRLAQILGLLGLSTLAIMAAVSWWWTGRVLQPIRTAYAELSMFTGAVAHELRSPLTALRTNSDSLLHHFDRLSPAELRQALQEFGEVTADMSQLVESLLLLARLRRDETGAELQVLNLREIAGEVVGSLAEGAARKGLTLALERDPGEKPLTVRAQPDYLRMMIRNLVENALQYTSEGGRVSLRCLEAGGEAELQVRDTGIGISPDDLDRVFDPFWRAERSRARHLGGAGLGLAIVSGLARAQRGSVAARSAPGEGSVFTIRFPLA